MENNPCSLEKNVYSAFFECSMDVCYVELIYSVVQIFSFQDDLLSSVEFSVFPLNCDIFCFINLGALLSGTYKFIVVFSS